CRMQLGSLLLLPFPNRQADFRVRLGGEFLGPVSAWGAHADSQPVAFQLINPQSRLAAFTRGLFVDRLGRLARVQFQATLAERLVELKSRELVTLDGAKKHLGDVVTKCLAVVCERYDGPVSLEALQVARTAVLDRPCRQQGRQNCNY